MMMNTTQPVYSIEPTRYYEIKPEFKGLGPERVSFFGAAPLPSHAYKVVVEGYSLRDSRNNTVSNYFYGKVIKTFEQAEEVCEKLNKFVQQCRASTCAKTANS